MNARHGVWGTSRTSGSARVHITSPNQPRYVDAVIDWVGNLGHFGQRHPDHIRHRRQTARDGRIYCGTKSTMQTYGQQGGDGKGESFHGIVQPPMLNT